MNGVSCFTQSRRETETLHCGEFVATEAWLRWKRDKEIDTLVVNSLQTSTPQTTERSLTFDVRSARIRRTFGGVGFRTWNPPIPKSRLTTVVKATLEKEIEKQGNPSVSTEQRRRHYGLHPPWGGRGSRAFEEGEAGTANLYGCIIKPDCDMDNPLAQKELMSVYKLLFFTDGQR
ncbi:hypothetical protein AVEN_96102-1 [Araneus ventricosus]|uniref:Uncharacterized protein n=1 Tax=Araneus ventricosus TaxID=182803 RepID=A0A4Y2B4B1_ARAVE|nr:hypothetical protein AVEN_96102-1 [Araneus ventricosus]